MERNAILDEMTAQAGEWIPAGAEWIGAAAGADHRGAPLMRREFSLGGTVSWAVLRICGLGYYEAWTNGRRIGDHVLDPAQTDYEERTFFVTYDVTESLQAGPNCLGVILGNGWYNQDRVWGNGGLPYGTPRLLAELQVTLADGSTVRLVSDGSWSTAPGPITDNNIYAGECYDARLELPGWSAAGFDDGSWKPVTLVSGPGGRLEPQTIPPIRKVEDLQPIEIRRIAPASYIVDMGQNFSGWARIRLTAAAGHEVRLRFAETLGEGGSIDTASTGVFATKVEQIDRYICKGGGEECWEPRFTYHGFRYVEVTGWPGELTAADITGVVVHTDLAVAGTFECSDDRLNQLHSMALWTHRSNAHGLPEDCPARERCGWLGDANLVAEYSLWNYDAKSFWEKYLGDIETTRVRSHGIPANVAPGKRCTGRIGNPDWGAAFIMLPWYLYLYTGDRAVPERHWDGMQQLMRHYESLADGWIVPGGYGDYFDPGADAVVVHTPQTLSTTFWVYRCSRVMATMATALQRPEEADTYMEWSRHIAAALRERFFDEETGSFGSQAANVLALAFRVLPDQDERVFQATAQDILARNTHANVGVMGVRFLFEELTQRGRGDLALALMHQNSYPSFGHLIERGATTLWECWGEQGHNETHGPRSLSHPFMGGYDNWFFNTLAGIQPDPQNPGFRHFRLCPHPIPGLGWVRAYHDSPFGRIVSEWRFDGTEFEWKVVVPKGTRATATVPFVAGEKQLESGVYEFRSTTDRSARCGCNSTPGPGCC